MRRMSQQRSPWPLLLAPAQVAGIRGAPPCRQATGEVLWTEARLCGAAGPAAITWLLAHLLLVLLNNHAPHCGPFPQPQAVPSARAHPALQQAAAQQGWFERETVKVELGASIRELPTLAAWARRNKGALWLPLPAITQPRANVTPAPPPPMPCSPAQRRNRWHQRRPALGSPTWRPGCHLQHEKLPDPSGECTLRLLGAAQPQPGPLRPERRATNSVQPQRPSAPRT